MVDLLDKQAISVNVLHVALPMTGRGAKPGSPRHDQSSTALEEMGHLTKYWLSQ